MKYLTAITKQRKYVNWSIRLLVDYQSRIISLLQSRLHPKSIATKAIQKRIVTKAKSKAYISLTHLLICIFAYLLFPQTISAATLTGYTLPSNARPNQTGVQYTTEINNVTTTTIQCIAFDFTRYADGSGGVPSGMVTTGTVFDAGSDYIPTPSSWSIDASTNGRVTLTNAAGETPAATANRTLLLNNIKNGSTSGTVYYLRVNTYNNTDCSSSLVDSGLFSYVFMSGVSVSVNVPDTRVSFYGSTSPNAFVTILDNAVVVGTTTANSAGGFSKLLTSQTPGIHSFGIKATDTQGNNTPTYSFVLNLINKTETIVSGIILPPTIVLDKTTYTQGEIVPIAGEAVPNSTLTVFVQSTLYSQNVTAKSNGDWSLNFNQVLDIGNHSTYAKVIDAGGGQSVFSMTKEFIVVAAPTPTPTPTPIPIPTGCTTAPDINGDGNVNLTDFSIMLYYWGTTNDSADLNCDNTVNLTDFSILLYYWH